MIDLDSMPPDWDFAESHAKASKPGITQGLHVKTGKSVYCQCCLKPVEKQPVPLTSNSKELEFLGFGFPLYYIFFKYSIILVLLLICSYSAVAIYWAIDLNESFCIKHRLLTSSQQTDPHCTSFLIIFSRIQDIVLGDQLTMRAASFFLHLATLIYIRDNIRKTYKYYDEKTTSLSDYSFIMKNLPVKDGIQKDIKSFVNEKFSSHWQQFQDTYQHDHFKASAEKVMHITLIPSLKDYFKLDHQKQHLINEKRKLLMREQKNGISPKVDTVEPIYVLEQTPLQKIEFSIKKIKDQIKRYNDDFHEKVDKDEIKAHIAIVTLNSESHRNVIFKYSEKTNLTKQTVGDIFGDFQGKINIEQAPEPNEIIWENMHYTAKDRIIGKIISWSLSILFIAACTVGFYFILVGKTDSLVHAIENYATEAEYKKSYDYRVSVFLVFFLMFSIVLFNKLMMSWVLHFFTHLEKNEYTSDDEYSFALKYTFGLFFTTALMTLAVEDITYDNFFTHEYGVIQQESIMFFVNAFFIPIFMLINPFQLKKIIARRFKKEKAYFTQAQANEIMKDHSYSMGKQYAEIIETLWFTFLYATMVPLGAVITLFGLGFYYWVDKMTLLRRSSLSHNVSGKMAMSCLWLLDCTLIMKPIGQIIFDTGIRDHVQVESIVLTSVAFVYIIIPKHFILDFFHSQDFKQEQKPLVQVEHKFLQTYQTLHPVMNYQIEATFRALRKFTTKHIALTRANSKIINGQTYQGDKKGTHVSSTRELLNA